MQPLKLTLLGLLQALIFLSVSWLVNKPSRSQNLNLEPIIQPQTEDGVTVLGQPCENPYVVAIPSSNPQILEKVQQYAPSAFLTNSPLGLYIQAGSFSDRAPAEILSLTLRQYNLDARVAYLPVPCNL